MLHKNVLSKHKLISSYSKFNSKFSVKFNCHNFIHIPQFYMVRRRNFCNNQTDNKRYHHEYEAPQSQDLSLTPLHERISWFLLKSILLGLTVYHILFKKYNSFAKKRKLYFINEYFEVKFDQYISSKVKSIMIHYIYKHDTPEVKEVYKIYKSLVKSIKLDSKVSLENVYVIESPSLGGRMFKNGDLFISNRILDLAQGNEDELAFYLSVLIADVLLGNSTSNNLKTLTFNLREWLSNKKPDENRFIFRKQLLDIKREELVKYHKLLLFYPETILNNYYEEIEILRTAIKIIHKSEYDLKKSIEIMRKFDQKMKYYHNKYDYTGEDYDFRYYDTCAKLVKIFLIK